jgi:DNA-binding MltR family transcriptional regulator
MVRRPILALTAWHYTDDEEREALNELEQLSDRAAGIVATTMLENSLDGVFQHELRDDDPALLKELFTEGGPLGTFAAKIKLLYALGLVTKDGRHDLDSIRKIRNVFAHKLSGNTFQSESIKDRCLSLRLIDKACVNGPTQLKTDARTKFFFTIFHLRSCLLVRSPRIKKLLYF